MKIHEYQAKALFRSYGIPVPSGSVAFTVEEAVAAARTLPGPRYVVKAQIHAGGRGKGGGVKVVDSLDGVQVAADQILGMQLITHQTGPEGQRVKSVLVEEASAIERELYLAIVMDRATARPVLMASQDGGMDIEEVAEKTPERILKEFIHPTLGLQAFQARKIVYGLNLPASAHKEALALIQNLYRLFIEKDCSLLEVNPLVLTADNRVFALDGKVNFDDNALYRQADVVALRDTDEEDPLEVEASKFHLNYIKLEGNVGCMVNGAGLAMATMDIIKLHGAAPANFLDVGGGASEEAIENAFRILLSDKSVQAVFINIFGGILRCDLLATGVVKAAKKLDMKLPLVIRMKGTNYEQGKAILAESGVAYVLAETMEEGAQAVVNTLKTAVVA
ncbi:MAG: ADP-forming succinate--CoA ligase subunit beta [Candidatus Melainabacteria bacterium]|nr:ADP-forming succinate--CoA ligase subunit beta [Candidatus Melainabacteria bacterium]